MKRLLVATICLIALGCHGGIFNIEQIPDSLEVRPSTMTFVEAGDFDSFDATVYDTDGFVIRGIDVQWTTSDASVATVNTNGGVVSQGNGFATITATAAGSLTATAEVNVVLPVVEEDFVSISAGGRHTCALTPLNEGFCWGANAFFQLRDGFSSRDSNIPVAMDYNPDVFAIAAGEHHNCALASGFGLRRPVCWGRADAGQVGQTGPTGAISAPRTMFFNADGVSIASGNKHSCFVDTNGIARCWANNANGQVGDGTTDIRFTPTEVSGGHTFESVAANENHTCALTPAGEAYCWGENDLGQVGDGTNDDKNVPTMVAGGIVFASLSGTCGLTAMGEAYCWGDNTSGQLGNGTNTHSNVPVMVTGGLTFQTLDSGSGFVCGLTTGGDAYCWGANADGQLGNGTTTDSNIPVMVTGGMTFTAIAAGGAHACAIGTDFDAYCWGDNNNGQLGDETNTDSSTPVRAKG